MADLGANPLQDFEAIHAGNPDGEIEVLAFVRNLDPEPAERLDAGNLSSQGAGHGPDQRDFFDKIHLRQGRSPSDRRRYERRVAAPPYRRPARRSACALVPTWPALSDAGVGGRLTPTKACARDAAGRATRAVARNVHYAKLPKSGASECSGWASGRHDRLEFDNRAVYASAAGGLFWVALVAFIFWAHVAKRS